MKTMLAPPRLAAVISFMLCLPFVILELVVNPRTKAHPFTLNHLTSLTLLFGLMWLLPTVFITVLVPIVRTIRAGNTIRAHPSFLVLRVVVLVIVAWAWGGLVLDQLPCFLGVPNCD